MLGFESSFCDSGQGRSWSRSGSGICSWQNSIGILHPCSAKEFLALPLARTTPCTHFAFKTKCSYLHAAPGQNSSSLCAPLLGRGMLCAGLTELQYLCVLEATWQHHMTLLRQSFWKRTGGKGRRARASTCTYAAESAVPCRHCHAVTPCWEQLTSTTGRSPRFGRGLTRLGTYLWAGYATWPLRGLCRPRRALLRRHKLRWRPRIGA